MKYEIETYEIETIEMPCIYCGTFQKFPKDSLEARGIFSVFCTDTDCEDRYGWREILQKPIRKDDGEPMKSLRVEMMKQKLRSKAAVAYAAAHPEEEK